MQILSKAINAPDIYEYDYRGFFDSINTEAAFSSMSLDWEIPTKVIEKLRVITMAVPTLPIERKMDESLADSKSELLGKAWSNITGFSPRDADDQIDDLSWMDQPDAEAKFDMMMLMVSAGHSPSELTGSNFQKGFPQGAPISPLLSIMPLAHLDRKVNLHRDRVRYADDFIEFPRGGATSQWQRLPKESILLKSHRLYGEFGITFAPEKCGFVKRGGKWLKPLKFLGLVYDGLKDTLSAQTRNGSALPLSDKEEFLRAYFEQEEHKAKASVNCESCQGTGCSRCSPNLLYNFKGMKGYS
jgi:hypothetical protein